MHTCPECGQACSCAGDCEDHGTGDEFYVECEHYLVCAGYDGADDEWFEDRPKNTGGA